MQTIVSVTPLSVQRDSRTYKIAASFARAGHRSIVVEGEASELAAASLPFELSSPRRRASAAATVGRARAWARRLPMAYDLARAARWLVRYNLASLPPADLYYLHAPYQLPAVARAGAPFVYDAHDFYGVLYDPPSPTVRWLERRCVARAAAVVTVSDGVADLMASSFGRRPVVIRNAEDTRLEQPARRRLRDIAGIPPDAFCVATTGNVKPGWTMDAVADAIARLPERFHLAIVGQPPANAVARPRIHFVPPVEPPQVAPLLRDADAFVIAYRALDANDERSLPNKFFHAVAAELPLLYPPLPEIARLAERHGIGVAIDPGCADSIRAAIMAVADPARRAAFAPALRAARAALSWEREEDKLLALLPHPVASAATACVR